MEIDDNRQYFVSLFQFVVTALDRFVAGIGHGDIIAFALMIFDREVGGT